MPKEKTNPKPLVFGLTGGIGSGKSTVLRFFKSRGAHVVDSDAMVHEILKNDKKILAAIKKKIGDGVFSSDGVLDRKKMATQVFASVAKRRFLEKLVHPAVRRLIAQHIKNNRKRICVVDVPLLYESGWVNKFKGIIVVNANLKNRIRRLRKKGFELSDIRKRIQAQWPLEIKVKLADFVVDNNEDKKGTKNQIDVIWKLINTQ